MGYYIVLSRPFDLEGIEKSAAADHNPRHLLWTLQQELGAKTVQPDLSTVTWTDKLWAKVVGAPEHWALARHLVAELNDDDVVFCMGEDVGLPLAVTLKNKGLKTQLAMTIMAPSRVRVRGTIQLFNLKSQIHHCFANTQAKVQALNELLSLPQDNSQVSVLPEQTDIRFFNPGEQSSQQRPVIASGGMEQRDYVTLAEATQDLGVDVKISAVSPNASAKTRCRFPDPVPDHLDVRRYDWQELRQLYRDADVVVISLLYNEYSAGLTTLIEAMACRRPVIFTRVPGVGAELIDRNIVVGVSPDNPQELKEAILKFLNDPAFADEMAERGYQAVMAEFTSEHHVHHLMTALKALNN